jgi:hypothetical protein
MIIRTIGMAAMAAVMLAASDGIFVTQVRSSGQPCGVEPSCATGTVAALENHAGPYLHAHKTADNLFNLMVQHR